MSVVSWTRTQPVVFTPDQRRTGREWQLLVTSFCLVCLAWNVKAVQISQTSLQPFFLHDSILKRFVVFFFLTVQKIRWTVFGYGWKEIPH